MQCSHWAIVLFPVPQMIDRKPDEDTDKLKTENKQLRMEIADVSISFIY